MSEHEQQQDGTVEETVPPTTPPTEDPSSAVPDDPSAEAPTGEAPAGDAVEGEVEAAPEAEPDWRDRYLRSAAELENVRRRARRDAAAGESRGIARVARGLLPALDNLERALQHASEDTAVDAADEQFVAGVRIVYRELHAALAQAGVEAFDPTGEAFDPHQHEALTQQPAPEGVEAGMVLSVYQTGYRLRDEILRPAKVVVSG